MTAPRHFVTPARLLLLFFLLAAVALAALGWLGSVTNSMAKA